eukprot:scaffold428419_cov22-Prasinocladus_malaysianus.AAC.1
MKLIKIADRMTICFSFSKKRSGGNSLCTSLCVNAQLKRVAIRYPLLVHASAMALNDSVD